MSSIVKEAVEGRLVKTGLSEKPPLTFIEELRNKNSQSEKKKLKSISPDEKKFEFPRNWIWCRFGEITEIVRGSSPRPKGSPQYFSKEKTEYPFVKIYDITNYSENDVVIDTGEFLTKEGSNYSRLVNPDDIIIAVSGSGSVGKIAKMGIKGFIYDGLIAFRNIEPDYFREFLFIFLKAKSSSFIHSAKQILKELISQLQKVDFRILAGLKADEKVTGKHFIVYSVREIIKTAIDRNWGLCKLNGFTYVYTAKIKAVNFFDIPVFW